ncbi:MAG: outer membrane protein assembly factor BamC [Pseudomonadota bacterium]
MTIRKNFRINFRKNFQLTQSNLAQRGLVYGVVLASLAGCNAIGSLIEPDRVDYKSTSKAPSLDVPPDLTQLQRENRYTIPDAVRGTATASGYNSKLVANPSATVAIASKGTADMRIERDNHQRWLVVKQAPEVLWPQIKDFWQDSGFVIVSETPIAGVMETDWAEDRAKIPQDAIRRTIGKVFDSLYATGLRDKFIIRLERGAEGTTEVFISHRGAEEVFTGIGKESLVWTARPSDPNLESEFLSRLMARLGADSERAKSMIANATPQAEHAKLMRGAAGSYVEVDEGFDRAWRRVGLALDRVGFTVEDRDRVLGLYFVRYIDQDTGANKTAVAKANEEKGFFSKWFSYGVDLFSFSSDKKSGQAGTAQRYRVFVKGAGPNASQVIVLNSEGVVAPSPTSEKILALLNDQLK